MLFLLAAVLKVVHPDSVVPAARLLTGMDVAIIVAGLVICEVVLGIWLVLFPGIVWMRCAAAAALLGFSGVLVALLSMENPPTCGCFGRMVEWRSARTELWAGLGRNAVLLACVLPSGRRAHAS
jgi:hypothetical protein